MQGVYQIKNLVDGKVYVGSSIDLQRRFKEHRDSLLRGIHPNTHLQNAWNMYGETSFEFSVLEEVYDPDILRSREKHYIDLLDCTNRSKGYNFLDNPNIGFGVSASAEVRKKISVACSGEKNGNFGRKHTEEELQRIRDNRWGVGYVRKADRPKERKPHTMSPEARKKLADVMHNRVITDETREKLRTAAKNRKISDDTRAKMSKSRSGLGNPRSKLTKEQVYEIYHKMHNGVNYKVVCEEYGIGQCQAYKIKRKEHWVFNDEK